MGASAEETQRPHAEPPHDESHDIANGHHTGLNGATGPIPAALPSAETSPNGERAPREPLRPEVRGEVGVLIDELRTLFTHDRTLASQSSSARCGICYLHFSRTDLVYREAEGFYVCAGCAQQLQSTRVFMVRRQQR